MSKTFDLSTLNLSAGTHEITVKARASGYTDSPASNAVSYVVGGATEETYTLSGTWRFKSSPNPLGKDIELSVNFTSDGDNYNKIRLTYYSSTSIEHIRFSIEFLGKSGSSGSDAREQVYYYEFIEGELHAYWSDQAYRTITFDGVQTVSKDFYEWFTANAIQAV